MKTIEFETSTPTGFQIAPSNPWRKAELPKFEDLILKSEYSERQFRFPVGATWFRVVPTLKGSSDWALGIQALSHPGGRHPKPTSRDKRTVFDAAYSWLKKNKPEVLFSKANRAGFRLLPDPLIAFWILVELEGQVVARIVVANGYDGSRNGSPGLGFQLRHLVEERDEALGRVSDPVDPEAGLQICVEKTQARGAKYPNYRLSLGRHPAPIQRYFDRMAPEEIDVIRPLEEVLRVIEPDHEWEFLSKVIGPELCAEIRAAIEPRKEAGPVQPMGR